MYTIVQTTPHDVSTTCFLGHGALDLPVEPWVDPGVSNINDEDHHGHDAYARVGHVTDYGAGIVMTIA